ncbi:MAG TPA: DoxX family protein [Actinobacteria bacterium]|nr:DoxX family protein [Actinomycetota bacterium]
MKLFELARQYGPLIGRLLLANIFITAGFQKILGFSGVAAYMNIKGMPMPEVLLVLTIIIELGGGLCILFGWQARWAALAIFLFLIPTSLIFHPYWTYAEDEMRAQFIQFHKNLAIMGGMLYVIAYGSGPFSVSKDK